MFEYAPGVTAPTKANVSAAFVALRETCRLPSGARYILAVDGGPNSSPEGKTHGMEVRAPAPPLCSRLAHPPRARSTRSSWRSAARRSATTTSTPTPRTRRSRRACARRSPTRSSSTLRAASLRGRACCAGRGAGGGRATRSMCGRCERGPGCVLHVLCGYMVLAARCETKLGGPGLAR